MLQEKLKQQTSILHDELEQLMFVGDIMKKSLTLTQYKKLLITNYLVHKQYEEVINDHIEASTAAKLNLPSRNKLNALALDLAQEKIDEKELDALSLNETTIGNNAFALGAMYVLEGATLGGSVIVKQLKQNLNFTNHNFNYYGCYKDQLIPNWHQFLQVLNNLPENEHNNAIDGAKFMFGEIATIAKMVNIYASN